MIKHKGNCLEKGQVKEIESIFDCGRDHLLVTLHCCQGARADSNPKPNRLNGGDLKTSASCGKYSFNSWMFSGSFPETAGEQSMESLMLCGTGWARKGAMLKHTPRFKIQICCIVARIHEAHMVNFMTFGNHLVAWPRFKKTRRPGDSKSQDFGKWPSCKVRNCIFQAF